jgi:hypothetical protein
MRYWLFYAGPENYLVATGERDSSREELLWSAAPEVAPRDLALLYRTSVSRLSVNEMVRLAGMSTDVAKQLKAQRIGSDIPLLWEVISRDLGPFGTWQSGCHVRFLTKIDPPLTLAELKGERALQKRSDLRWNFQAEGRDALEIPGFAWKILKRLIRERSSQAPEQLPSALR